MFYQCPSLNGSNEAHNQSVGRRNPAGRTPDSSSGVGRVPMDRTHRRPDQGPEKLPTVPGPERPKIGAGPMDRKSKVSFAVVSKDLKSLHSLHGVHEVCTGLPPDVRLILKGSIPFFPNVTKARGAVFVPLEQPSRLQRRVSWCDR